MKRQSKWWFYVISILLYLMCYSGPTWAGSSDGMHDFSLVKDGALGGVPGYIYYTSETGTAPTLDFHINHTNDQATDFDIDALSGVHDAHDVSLWDVIYGVYDLMYSIDGESNIYEWLIDGQPLTQGPRSGYFAHVHDKAVDMDLCNYDLDALESHDHPRYPIPFPGVPYDWEDHAVYYSLERTNNQADEGDIFFGNTSGWAKLYLDDTSFNSVFNNYDDKKEQLDALIVYDVAGGVDSFDTGTSLVDSDFVLFSLAPGTVDPVGDNIYWYSALGQGGLYLDPGLTTNVDALDNHPVPEPSSILLFASGGLGWIFSRRKRASTQ